MRTLASIALTVFALLAAVPQVEAQSSHVAPAAVLDAAIQAHVASSEADRETASRFIARPDVQKSPGGGHRHAPRRVGRDDARPVPVVRLAAQARQAEEALAGGQSRVTISTTLIIIALLVLILIIVAVD